MPTPVGHALGGLATAWFGDAAARKPLPDRRVAVTCAIVAMLPDLDILVGSHRSYSHSVGALVIAGVLRGSPAEARLSLRVALTIAAVRLARAPRLDGKGQLNSARPDGVRPFPPASTFRASISLEKLEGVTEAG